MSLIVPRFTSVVSKDLEVSSVVVEFEPATIAGYLNGVYVEFTTGESYFVVGVVLFLERNPSWMVGVVLTNVTNISKFIKILTGFIKDSPNTSFEYNILFFLYLNMLKCSE